MKRFSTLVSRANKVNELKGADKQQEEGLGNNSTLFIRKILPQIHFVVIKAIILGPRGSGKTSFLYRAYFKYNQHQPDTHFDVIPTPAHNVEVIPYQTCHFELWDFAGKRT